jgi:hypothetical protein
MCSSAIFASPSHFFSNAGKFQAGTIIDVILEIGRVFAKICLNSYITKQLNSWEKAIHCRTDWNFLACILDLLGR